MARRRASMREGPLAELFRATEAAQKQAEQRGEAEQPPAEDAATAAPEAPAEPDERTVEHVPSWEEAGVETPVPPTPSPEPMPGPPLPDPPSSCRRFRTTSNRCRTRPRGCTAPAPTRAPTSR